MDVGEASAAPYRLAASGSVDMGIKMKDNNGVWVPLGGGVEICLDSNGNIDSIKGTTRYVAVRGAQIYFRRISGPGRPQVH